MGGYVFHYDGVDWTRMDTGTTGDFWWVHGAEDDSVFMVGTNGLAVQYHPDVGFTPITTPSEVDLFGAFVFDEENVLTCGGNATSLTDTRQVLWEWDGETLAEPAGFANERGNNDVLTKLFARSPEDVWVIGGPDEGLRLRDDAWNVINMGTDEHLTTIHGNDDLLIAAGGLGRGVIVENDGSGFKQIDVGSIQPLNGISVHADGRAAASGWYGFLMLRDLDGSWQGVQDLDVRNQVFHSVSVTPDGTVYAAGANFFVTEVNDGLLLKGKLPGSESD
jgi:hypothetical protein